MACTFKLRDLSAEPYKYMSKRRAKREQQKGDIMRRILKKVAAGEFEAEGFGDTSTLADPATVDMAVEGARALLK